MQEPPVIERLEFHCCYCDQKLERAEIHSVVLVWPGVDDEHPEQTWWCHRDCFVDSLNPGYRMMRDAKEDASETANGC